MGTAMLAERKQPPPEHSRSLWSGFKQVVFLWAEELLTGEIVARMCGSCMFHELEDILGDRNLLKRVYLHKFTQIFCPFDALNGYRATFISTLFIKYQ